MTGRSKLRPGTAVFLALLLMPWTGCTRKNIQSDLKKGLANPWRAEVVPPLGSSMARIVLVVIANTETVNDVYCAVPADHVTLPDVTGTKITVAPGYRIATTSRAGSTRSTGSDEEIAKALVAQLTNTEGTGAFVVASGGSRVAGHVGLSSGLTIDVTAVLFPR